MRLFGRWCGHDWEPLELVGVKTSNFQYMFRSKCNKCGKEKDIEERLLIRDKTRRIRHKWDEEHKDTFADYCYMCKERMGKWEQTTEQTHLTLHLMLEIKNKPSSGGGWSVEEAWIAAGCG